MKIPKALPQFERFPALFITSGEYEAFFHVAFNGQYNCEDTIKIAPREVAKDKQIFVGHKGGMQSLSAFSDRGNFINELKHKFARSVQAKIKDIIDAHKIDEIYLFAPKYVAKRIMDALDDSEQKKVRMQFYKEYTKSDPLKLIEVFENEIANIQKLATESPQKQVFLK